MTMAFEQPPPIDPQKRRRGPGRPFVKGQVANPEGARAQKRNGKARGTITELARDASPKAMETLINVMQDRQAPHGVRCSAAAHILDRAWGKPLQTSIAQVNHSLRVQDLTDAQLLAIIAGAAPADVLAGVAYSEPQSHTGTPLIEGEVDPGSAGEEQGS